MKPEVKKAKAEHKEYMKKHHDSFLAQREEFIEKMITTTKPKFNVVVIILPHQKLFTT